MGDVVTIGDATLYHGDCLEILPTLDKVDAVVTDPPYGISVDKTMSEQGGERYGKAKAAKSHYDATDWDAAPMSADAFRAIRRVSRWQIVFGGNYFDVPPSSCWLVWDKENGGNQFADCELAWTNIPKPVRQIRHLWNGMLRAGQEQRHGHPTQKPLRVMEWAIGHLPVGDTILDPFMGSGTTGVACANLGRKFIGIELERKYFDIACERIDAAYSQGRLFA